MVAIGPQTQRQSDFMAGQHGLPFPVLTDPDNAVAEKFGLVYTIPEYHRDYYLSILVKSLSSTARKAGACPLPATYVIAKDRKVVFAEAHADFRVRPEPEEVLVRRLRSTQPHRLRIDCATCFEQRRGPP